MFAQNLKATRRVHHLTQQNLADQLYVSRQTVSSWETGRNLPNLETTAQLATCLHVSVDELLGRRSQPQPTAFPAVPIALAIMLCSRLAIATTSALLLLADGFIVGLMGLLWWQRRGAHPKALLMGGLLLTGVAWGQILEMPSELQTLYVFAGAPLLAEAFCRLYQVHLERGLFLMKHKGWWLANTILTVLFASGIYVVLTRRVDGTGHLETLQSRLLSLAVLGVLAVVIILVQLVIWRLLKAAARR